MGLTTKNNSKKRGMDLITVTMRCKIPRPETTHYSQGIPVLLGTYRFPGNIRELRSMIYDAVSRHSAGILSMEAFRNAAIGAREMKAEKATEGTRDPEDCLQEDVSSHSSSERV